MAKQEAVAVEDDSEPDLLTTHQAAVLLQCSFEHLQRMANAGKIPGRKLFGTRWRFSRRQLIKHIEEGNPE